MTFGSHDKYIAAATRLIEQARDTALFDKIELYVADDLKHDKYFWNLHKDFIENNKRGYGYWLWKPYLIKKTIDQMTDGDILLYLDCGCEIYLKEKQHLIDCMEVVKSSYIVGTFTDKLERRWNKMDTLLMLDANDDKYLNTYQRQGGAILFFVCDKTRSLVNEWYKIACDYHMIDDTPSVNKNYDCVVEHRHDQAIFSILTKKYELYSDIPLDKSCIYCLRNRSSISKLTC